MKNFKVTVNGNTYNVLVEEINNNNVSEINNNITSQVKTAPAPTQSKPTPSEVKSNLTNSNESSITAPMPGTIINIGCKVGDKVNKGDVLIILEAMKMENEIVAPNDGIISKIEFSQGASVNAGDILITM